jgi:hypothetical protein
MRVQRLAAIWLAGLMMGLAIVVTGGPEATASVPATKPSTYRYGFCAALERYDAAVTDWSARDLFPASLNSDIRAAARTVILRRREAWQAIQAERNSASVDRFARNWFTQHYKRVELWMPLSWQNAARDSDRFISQYCPPLFGTPAPIQPMLTRLL